MARYRGFNNAESQQEEDEFLEFVKFAQEKKVTKYLEIGMAHGITFHGLVTSLPKEGFYVGVDLPVDHPAGPMVIGQVATDLTLRGYQAIVMYGSSRSETIKEAVHKLGPFDLIMIDGDHTLEGVEGDFEAYKDCTKFMAFHDICSGFVVGFGVSKFWNSIKDRYKNQEIIGNLGRATGMGIGIIETGL